MDKTIISLSNAEAAIVVEALTKYIKDLNWDIYILKQKIEELKAGAADGEKAE